MKVAVPLFGKDVAPRFRYADRFLVAEIAEEQVVVVDHIDLDFAGWPFRLGFLRDLGVDVILCGGFNRCFTPLAESLGVRILTDLNGVAEKVVEAFARGETMSTFQRNGVDGRAGRACIRNRGRERKRGPHSSSQ
jgi:predicted Fe-Mo cluster-binding NifX family protein